MKKKKELNYFEARKKYGDWRDEVKTKPITIDGATGDSYYKIETLDFPAEYEAYSTYGTRESDMEYFRSEYNKYNALGDFENAEHFYKKMKQSEELVIEEKMRQQHQREAVHKYYFQEEEKRLAGTIYPNELASWGPNDIDPFGSEETTIEEERRKKSQFYEYKILWGGEHINTHHLRIQHDGWSNPEKSAAAFLLEVAAW